ncbi:MAG: hypothetical protein PVH61_05245 [Candidatus Aminicenantes bacterium]|jgi:hypothetical protein
MTDETTFNEKLLWMFHGPGGGFLEKIPLAAGVILQSHNWQLRAPIFS